MLKHLRLIGFIEGMSYILLIGICMPLKYIYEIPEPTRYMGMAHGVLFIYFCLLVLIVGRQLSWSLVTIGLALLSSLIPFGTFVADFKLFRA